MTTNPPNPPNPSSGAKVYEMQWDCRFCGTKKLLGKTHRFCPNCGGQQDPSWRYFPSDAEKVAVQDHVYVGADKVCAACKTLNSAKAEFCTNCGAPMTKAAEAKRVGERKQVDGQAFETEDLKARQRAAQQAPMVAAAAVAKPVTQPKSRRNTCLVVLVVLALIIGGGAFALTRTSTSNAIVTGYRWERSIEIEVLQPISQSQNGSCSSAPSDSYNRDQRTEKTGSHQEADGQTCTNKQVDQGDGTFKEERECSTNYKSVDDFGPVCHYVVNQWNHSRSVTSQGDKTTAPYWGDISLQGGGCSIVGCEREPQNSRKEIYYLEFKAGDKTFECPVPVDQWNNTKVEAAFTVQVGSVLKDVRCDTLKPA